MVLSDTQNIVPPKAEEIDALEISNYEAVDYSSNRLVNDGEEDMARAYVKKLDESLKHEILKNKVENNENFLDELR